MKSLRISLPAALMVVMLLVTVAFIMPRSGQAEPTGFQSPIGTIVIGDYVWYDAARTGQHSGPEAEYRAGINGVVIDLYLDNGDRSFDPAADLLRQSTPTGPAPGASGGSGWYNFVVTVPQGSDADWWVVVNPDNFAPGHVLAGHVLTSAGTFGPSPLLVTVSAQNPANYLNADFGYVKEATPPPGICVKGQVINKNHKGISGVTVHATSTGQPEQSVVTDQNGYFTFDNLVPGTWTFKADVPASWEPLTPAEIIVDLSYGDGSCYDIRFKFNQVGCLIVHKQDQSGNPLQSWKITASARVDPSQLTDSQGNARFDNLPPGRYVVTEELQYPYKPIGSPSQTVDVHASASANDCTLVTFENELQPTACITGYKIDDKDQRLSGWRVYAAPVDGGAPRFQEVTDGNGRFTFQNLTLGTWKIWEDVKAWWVAITPSSFKVTLTEPSPDCNVIVRFKNRAPDLCAEGHKIDEYGRPLAGWQISAYPANNPSKVITATTDSRGYYRLVDLTETSWIFQEQLQAGWTAISPDHYEVAVKPGNYCTQVPTFRNRSPRGCVDGFKRDERDLVGLAGWNISLQPVDGGSYQHRVTDGTGHFRFENLPVGEYLVWEEMQPGWAAATPPKLTINVTASTDNQCQQVQFVNRQVPRDICIDGFKLDALGGVGLPGFAVTAVQLNGSARLTATTDGIGYFRFPNLQPGTYKVSVTEQPGWAPAGPTSFTLKVDWPPKLKCTRVKFWDRQSDGYVPPTGQADKASGTNDATPASTPSSSECQAWHTIEQGQTLGDIAAAYGTSVQALVSANGVVDPNRVYAGQKLCVK